MSTLPPRKRARPMPPPLYYAPLPADRREDPLPTWRVAIAIGWVTAGSIYGGILLMRAILHSLA